MLCCAVCWLLCPADYALLCVDAGTGLTRITREHLAVAVALEVPTAIVVTKADAVDDQQLQQVLQQLTALMQPVLSNCLPQQQPRHIQAQEQQQQVEAPQLQGGKEDSRHTTTTVTAAATSSTSSTSSSAVHTAEPDAPGPACRMAWATPSGVPVVQSEQQAIGLAASLSELHSCTAAPAAPSFQQAVFPVFVVSCVSGAGIHLLHAFLSRLRSLQVHKQEQRRGCEQEHQQEQVDMQEQQQDQQQEGQQERQQEGQRELEQASGVLSVSSASTAQQQGHAAAKAAAEASSARAAPASGGSPARQQQPAVQQMTPSKDGSSQLWGVSPHKHKAVPGASAATTAAAAGTAAAAATAGSLGQGSALCAEDAAVGVSGERDEGCRPGHFQVVHTYDVEGVGWVVSGIAVTGTCAACCSLMQHVLCWLGVSDAGVLPPAVLCLVLFVRCFTVAYLMDACTQAHDETRHL